MQEVLRFFPETKFLFVGGGNVDFYRKMILRMGISEKNFAFIGHLEYFERSKILQSATVFVNPSFFENCSISILEAMSCGCAVVASDVGGNPEIIETGKNGVLVPAFSSNAFAKSIVSLLENEMFNKKMGIEARNTIERMFSSKLCAEKTCEVYEQALNAFK